MRPANRWPGTPFDVARRLRQVRDSVVRGGGNGMAQASDAPPPLRIGFVGSGFIAKFHAKSFQSVRHAQIAGVYSPTAKNRDALVQEVNDAELGPCRAYADLES